MNDNNWEVNATGTRRTLDEKDIEILGLQEDCSMWKAEVERLTAEQGSQVELDRVLLVADEGKVMVGRPFVEGAKVLAEAVGEGKGKKIIVFKYKPKVRYRRKKGHRQQYTSLAIKDIILAKRRKSGAKLSGT